MSTGMTRKFNGKSFTYHRAMLSADGAKTEAERLQRKGYLVRVTPTNIRGVYEVWAKRK